MPTPLRLISKLASPQAGRECCRPFPCPGIAWPVGPTPRSMPGRRSYAPIEDIQQQRPAQQDGAQAAAARQIGSASVREGRVPYVRIGGGAGSLKKKKK